MDINQLKDIQPALNSLGILGILALIVFTGFRRMWHTHGEYEAMVTLKNQQLEE